MSAHTPGPWAHRNGRIYQADREELTIAHVARALDGDYSLVNGRLIAAAPQLLESAQAAWNCVVDLPPSQANSELVRMLSGAISAATGAA